jgi:hypothetical protein
MDTGLRKMTKTDKGQPSQTPANERLRRPAPNVLDQRQQQIDPAGQHRRDPDARPDSNRKQPGGSPEGDRPATEDDA